MANKNHKKYKSRKLNNVKQPLKSLFPDPPKIIHSWDDLVGLENDMYYLEIDIERDNGYIKAKFETTDEDFLYNNFYLSTHTFYGHQYFESTRKLRACGFNVQLINWDGETLFCS